MQPGARIQVPPHQWQIAQRGRHQNIRVAAPRYQIPRDALPIVRVVAFVLHPQHILRGRRFHDRYRVRLCRAGGQQELADLHGRGEVQRRLPVTAARVDYCPAGTHYLP